MDTTYFFSAFGTFGNPYGFRQSFFLGGNRNIAKEIRTYDLKTDAIKLFPQSSIYSIRKDFAGDCNLISYAVYKFAKEQNSDRGGTFIGSSLLFIDKIASESLVINTLNDFQDQLEKNNLSEGTIAVNHSDNFSIRKPKDFDKIGFNVREMEDLNFTRATQNYLVIYCETNPAQLQNFFTKALDLLNVYDTLYFTQSHEIAEFVKQKGIFKIVDTGGFNKEIEKFHEERLREVQNAVADLKKEKENLKEEKTQLMDDLRKQVERNEKKHQENEVKIQESKTGIDLISREYEQYAEKIDTVIRNLESDGKVETAKKRYLEHKKTLINTISQNKDIESLDSISSFNTRAGNSRENRPYGNDLAEFNKGRRNHEEKEFRLDVFKVLTFVLSLLLILVVTGCFVFLDAGKLFQISL